VAVSGNGIDWHLVNASPDVTRQIELFVRPRLRSGREARDTPVHTIFLTNADLDHTLGIFQLREGEPLTVTAPGVVRQSLERGPGMSVVLNAYAGLSWHPSPVEWRAVDDTNLEVRAVPLDGAGPPRYDREPAAGVHAVGYVFRQGGATVGFFPDVAVLTETLRAEIAVCDRVWFDGTFWDAEELVRLGFSGRNATDMGHIPISGDDGSLEFLSTLGPNRAAYLHINNTNPILRPDSDERKQVEAANVGIAGDGDHFIV
jgi:pyrroloquinoline quinone biosynthesis protein B